MKLLITITLRCPKHPRFDPEKGEGEIKGGCSRCLDILALYQRAFDRAEEIRLLPGLPEVKFTRI